MTHDASMSDQFRDLALRAESPQAVATFAMQKSAPSCFGRCARRYAYNSNVRDI
jgi:hypothetical protein